MLALAVWLLALVAFALVLVGKNARVYGVWEPQGGVAALFERLDPYFHLTLELLFSAALIALACAVACATLLSRRVVHLRSASSAGAPGWARLFDLGDSAVLGKLLPSRGSPACVLEQMVTWHGQQRPSGGAGGRPLPWCVLRHADARGAAGSSASCRFRKPPSGQSAARPLARRQHGDVTGWEVRLSDVSAVEGTHWLLCEGGTVVSTLKVALSAPAELAAYLAAVVVMQLIKRIDVFSGDRGEGQLADVGGGGCDLSVDDLGREIVDEAALELRREYCARLAHERMLMTVEDALTLAVLVCLALLSASAHSGALFAWARARLSARGGAALRLDAALGCRGRRWS